jgi:hypothetical protein
MKKIIVVCCALVFVFVSANVSVLAQVAATEASLEKDLELIRRDLRNEKKKIIAMNVPLTATEATKFWPVYDQYAGDMTKVYDEFYAIIKDYATNQKSLTDDQAISMIKRWSDNQVRQAQTRQKYVPLIEKVIPGKKAALFFQIDRRLYALMDLQVASEVPLVYQ